MPTLTALDTLYLITAFLFHLTLTIHFSLRKWRFATALRYGPIVYALSLPAALASLILLLGGANWSFWLAGCLYLIFAIFGYTVEYVRKIEWRDPILPAVFFPYITLYLAATMFYWFPLALLWRPFWYAAGGLFILNTYLNITSHQPASA